MKLWWCLLLVAIVLPMIVSATIADSDLWEEDDKEVLVRSVRGTKVRNSGNGNSNNKNCRYSKSEWSECDPKTNMRSRLLTLKKGDKSCEQTKTITKNCKKGKACRYEKGSWTSCEDQIIARVDTLKANSDPACEKTRRLTKRCKSESNAKKATKDQSKKKSKSQ